MRARPRRPESPSQQAVTRRFACLAGAAALVTAPARAQAPADPLPSWAPGPARRAILDFVAQATRPGPGFVPSERRVAAFDNDGTLWVEQPLYTQFRFVIDRARAMVAADPALRAKPAFAVVAAEDPAALKRLSEAQLMALDAAVQAGLTPEQFTVEVRTWLERARDPRFGRRYTELVYQPQLELLAFLRQAGFRTYIVSGGDVQFMRAFAQAAYGVRPEQVIGSSLKARFEIRDGTARVVYQPALASLDDGPEKPVNIALHIGQPPTIAVGNSDGDLAMLQYSARERPSLQVLVHHDDAAREYAYDRGSAVGRLDKALDEAARRGWLVVSMKRDWRQVFAPAVASP